MLQFLGFLAYALEQPVASHGFKLGVRYIKFCQGAATVTYVGAQKADPLVTQIVMA